MVDIFLRIKLSRIFLILVLDNTIKNFTNNEFFRKEKKR